MESLISHSPAQRGLGTRVFLALERSRQRRYRSICGSLLFESLKIAARNDRHT